MKCGAGFFNVGQILGLQSSANEPTNWRLQTSCVCHAVLEDLPWCSLQSGRKRHDDLILAGDNM